MYRDTPNTTRINIAELGITLVDELCITFYARVVYTRCGGNALFLAGVFGGLVMRLFNSPRQLLAAVIAGVLAGGCSNFFPSFSNNITALDVDGDEIPVAEVVNSVQCEIAEYLVNEPDILKKDEPHGAPPIRPWLP